MIPDVSEFDIPIKVTALNVSLWVLGILFICACILLFFLFIASLPPSTFLTDSTISIEHGKNITEIVDDFKDAGYVRSSNLLHAYLIVFGANKTVQAGTYVFREPISALKVARLIVDGPTDVLAKVTFPEGITTDQFAQIAQEVLPAFKVNEFLELAKSHEGQLFPDTYFVPTTFTEEQLFDLLRQTYDRKIFLLQESIEQHSLTEYEIVTLASLIEREANTIESMRMISGILQNRLKMGMALQADASIEYILDKPLSKLTPEDLKIDSPYNTYLYVGLPPTPIGNPGLDAIEAVLYPTISDNFYYLTDTEGVFHYAKTFSQHRANIARYLR